MVKVIEPVTYGTDVINPTDGLPEGDYILVTTNTTGGNDTQTVTVTTTDPTSITLNADLSGTIYICSGNPVTVTYTATITPVAAFTYNWTNSGGTATPSGNTNTIIHSAAGTYTVMVTVKGMTETITTVVEDGTPAFTLCEDNVNDTVTLKALSNTTQIDIYNDVDVLKRTIAAPTKNQQLVAEIDNYAAGTYKIVASNANCAIEETAVIARVHTTCNVPTALIANEAGSGSVLDSVQDHEGNWYDVVQIGSQCWLRENMRAKTSPSTHTEIFEHTASSYSYSGKKAYVYNNDESNIARYGLLYNWNAAVDTFNTGFSETSTSTSSSNSVSCTFTGNRRGICPAGWHLPTEIEWKTIELAMSMSGAEVEADSYRGTIAAKLAGGCDWKSSSTENAAGNYSATDRGVAYFSCTPAGCRTNSFREAGTDVYFWVAEQNSSTEGSYRRLNYDKAGEDSYYRNKYYARSVRCVRN